LLAAFDQVSGIVLGQCVVEGKTNEITAFAPLLDRFDLENVVVTADALHTQRAHAEYLHARGAHYVLTVKETSRGCVANSAPYPGPASPPSTSLATRATAGSRPAP